MADGVFNISKGAFAEKIRDNDALVAVALLQANEAEATLVDRDNMAILLAQGGNTEATFTSYARKRNLTGTVTVDDTNDRVDCDIPDQTWSPAGNGTNNTLTKLLVYYEEALSDADDVPMTHHDFAVTTDGSDLTAQLNAAGFARAS